MPTRLHLILAMLVAIQCQAQDAVAADAAGAAPPPAAAADADAAEKADVERLQGLPEWVKDPTSKGAVKAVMASAAKPVGGFAGQRKEAMENAKARFAKAFPGQDASACVLIALHKAADSPRLFILYGLK